jgi:deoxycytidylate deaminase
MYPAGIIEYLYDVSKKSDLHTKHAAAIYENKRNIINIASNNSIFHAEHNVLKKITSIKKLTLIVVRFNSEGRLVNSYPCNECVDILKFSGIKNIWYSNENGALTKEKVDNLKKIHISIGMRKANNASKINQNKIKYKLNKQFNKI